MKMKFLVEYDDSKPYPFIVTPFESDGIYLKHSGSSYLRIKKEGEQYQLGTIGGHCPGSERVANLMDEYGCHSHDHLTFAIEKIRQTR